MLDRDFYTSRDALKEYTEEWFRRPLTAQNRVKSKPEKQPEGLISVGHKSLKPGERVLEVEGQTFTARDLGGRNVPDAFRARKGGGGLNSKYGR